MCAAHACAMQHRVLRRNAKECWILPTIAVSAMYRISTARFDANLGRARGLFEKQNPSRKNSILFRGCKEETDRALNPQRCTLELHRLANTITYQCGTGVSRRSSGMFDAYLAATCWRRSFNSSPGSTAATPCDIS